MPPQTFRSPGRLLAPFALFAVFVALLLIVLGSSGRSETETTEPSPRVESTASPETSRPARRASGNVYTVRSGDTLSLIAQRTGIAVERLQELNPDLDAQTLVTGQRIKLRQ